MTEARAEVSQPHPFSADRPISRRTEDRLGRAALAGSIASAIRSWTGRESIVLGIYGSWGVGKTSLKNLVLEELASTDPRPDVLEFNPWQYDDFEALRRAFFDQLGRTVGRKDSSQIAQKLAKRLSAYGTAIAVGETVARGLPAAIPALILLLGAIGLGSTGLAAALSLPVVAVVSAALIVVGGLLGSLHKLSDWLANAAAKWATTRQKTAPELKKEIAELLRARGRSVLVVMDDVDRLEVSEIRRLIQLVKVNADFPNVVYLLLFQRDVVERALGMDEAQPGRRFLEKIVQFPFDVPGPSPEEVHQVLFEGLDRILAPHLKGRRLDRTRWANIFVPGLSGYFDSLRSVHRFVSTVEFHFGLLSKTGTLEVDPVDLIAIEVLRLFEPEVHIALRGAKQLFTGDDPFGTGDSEPRKQAVIQIVNLAEENHRTKVREILRELFPPIDSVFGGTNYRGTVPEKWERDLRVCTVEFFDRYFRLDVRAQDLSQADLLPLLSATASRDELSSLLRELERRGLLPLALSRLEPHKQTRDHTNAAAFVTAIFDVGDLLPESTPGFTISPLMNAARVVRWFLMSDTGSSLRRTVLEQATIETTGLILPIQQVSLEEPEDERQDRSEGILREEDLPHFRDLCREKIEEAVREDKLLKNPHLLYILFRWKNWGGQEAARLWVGATIADPGKTIQLLQRFVQVASSRGLEDYTLRTHSFIDLRVIEEFVEIEVVKRAVEAVDIATLSEVGVRAVRCFSRAIHRRAEGKSDDPRSLWREEDWD
jgi:predicted KAP-like P-loop ATPase